jgi:hypothetical protein
MPIGIPVCRHSLSVVVTPCQGCPYGGVSREGICPSLREALEAEWEALTQGEGCGRCGCPQGPDQSIVVTVVCPTGRPAAAPARVDAVGALLACFRPGETLQRHEIVARINGRYSPRAVDGALTGLVRGGVLQRVGHGVYRRPAPVGDEEAGGGG